MIAFLMGEIAAIQRGDRSVITLNVGGVGYRVQVPDRLLKEIPDLGQPLQIFTHLVVRDSDMLLYGFKTASERDVFVELIKVSGVGPALGLALLSTLGLSDLIQAVVSNNTRVLALAPGVGSKTAQRLALELKTKLATWRDQMGADIGISEGGPAPTIREDVEMALLALGYRPQEIAQALQGIARQSMPTTTEDWLRAAIAYLSDLD